MGAHNRHGKGEALTEREFQDLVIRLADTCGWLVYHTYDSRRSRPGYPDLTLVSRKKNRVVFAELKTQKGHLTVDQQYWGEQLKGISKIEYYLWRPQDWQSGEIGDILGKAKVKVNHVLTDSALRKACMPYCYQEWEGVRKFFNRSYRLIASKDRDGAITYESAFPNIYNRANQLDDVFIYDDFDSANGLAFGLALECMIDQGLDLRVTSKFPDYRHDKPKVIKQALEEYARGSSPD